MDELWGVYVPTWITAIATTLAFVAASAAGITAWRSLRIDQLRAASAQARLVSAWWVKDPDGVQPQRWGVLIVNRSEMPIFDVEIHADGNKNPEAPPPSLRVLAPGATLVATAARSGSFAWTYEQASSESDFVPLTYSKTHTVWQLTFLDSAGLEWIWRPNEGHRLRNPKRDDQVRRRSVPNG